MSTLIYVYDPMCSWCYGFRPTWKAILQGLPDGVTVQTRLGGLAPDSNTPMSDAMRDKLAATWHRIESMCQVSFDHAYWDQRPNPPRSTYIAGRAVRAAQSMGLAEWDMVEAIQDAYYQSRANVWDTQVLVEIAKKLGLDGDGFAAALENIRAQHELEVRATAQMGVTGYPSLVWEQAGELGLLPIDYGQAQTTLAVIRQLST